MSTIILFLIVLLLIAPRPLSIRLLLLIPLLISVLGVDAQSADVTCPGALSSRLEPNSYAVVMPGVPNNVRAQPTIDSERIGQIPAGGVMTVLDGPICADGYAWYQADYEGQVGWTVESFQDEYTLDETISPQTGSIQGNCDRLTYQPADTPGALWQVHLATVHETILFDEAHTDITSRVAWYGSRVVFAGVVNDVEGLYTRDVSADDPAALLLGGKVDHPQWSPDGERIAFTLVDADGVEDLALINADGSGLRRLTETPDTIEFDIDWSPDGRALVYTATVIRTKPPQLHILALADDDEPSIGRPILSEYYGSSAPDWGVNGIAFTGAQMNEPSNLRTYIYDPASETVRTVTALNRAMYARWSPDGRWLALRGWVDDTPRAKVYVVDAATDTIQWEAPHEPDDSLRWSADGAYLAFDYLDEGWQVATLAMATGRVQQWGEGRNPDWRGCDTLDTTLLTQPVTSNASWSPVTRRVDELTQVLVPPGCFMMGDPDWPESSTPAHEVCLEDAFWLDQTEVSQADFARLGGTQARESHYVGPTLPVMPNWYEAREFCALRGMRLPTEAEWEYAARGPDGLVYPWGNEWNPFVVHAGGRANSTTAPVGSYPEGASWVGALDMTGNVREWTSSLPYPYPYNPARHESDSDTEDLRIARGGGFNIPEVELRAVFRSYGEVNTPGPGVRCVVSAGP